MGIYDSKSLNSAWSAVTSMERKVGDQKLEN